ncbi:MAG: TolC family protein [Gemmatimonadaceae bacterium]
MLQGNLRSLSESALRRRRQRVRARSAAAVLVAALISVSHTVSAQIVATRRAITLNEVIRRAVESSPLIDAARARLQAARGSRLSAGTLPNPILTYQVENAGFPSRATPFGLTRETSTFATLPLESIWQRWPRVKKADENVRAADAELSMIHRQVAIDAARAFFRLALAQVSVNASTDILEGLDSLVRYSRARVAEGATAEGDLIRLQVERGRAATDRVLQQTELARARGALAPFVDDSSQRAGAASFVVVHDDSLVITGVTLAPASAFTARTSLRPDVLAARARVAASVAESTIQRTLLVRQLGATIGTKSTGGSYSMIAGLSLPFPLFDQNRGEVQRATSERLAAERELVWLERQSSAEIEAAYEAAQLLTTEFRVLDQQFLARAAEARRIAVAAYEEGAAPLLQVIDATRTLADARLTYYRALFAWQGSLLDLYAAAGLDPLSALNLTPPPSPSPAQDAARATRAPKGKE